MRLPVAVSFAAVTGPLFRSNTPASVRTVDCHLSNRRKILTAFGWKQRQAHVARVVMQLEFLPADVDIDLIDVTPLPSVTR